MKERMKVTEFIITGEGINFLDGIKDDRSYFHQFEENLKLGGFTNFQD